MKLFLREEKMEVDKTEGWDKDQPLTAGRIFQNRIGWNANMMRMIAEDRIGLLNKLAMAESNIQSIAKDSVELAKSGQILTPRGVNRVCRFWGKGCQR